MFLLFKTSINWRLVTGFLLNFPLYNMYDLHVLLYGIILLGTGS